MWKSPLEINRTNNIMPFTKESADGNFLDNYEGGWQDLLPNIGAPTNYSNANFGVHGELYSLPFNYEVIKNSPKKVIIKLYTRMKRPPPFYREDINY